MDTSSFLQDYEKFYGITKKSLREYRIEEIALIKTVRERLCEAREMNDLTPKQAARLLKIDSKFLCDVETGSNGVHGIPLKLILEATAAYEVSLDFIFGLESIGGTCADEAERDICNFLRLYQTRLFTEWGAKQLVLERQMEAVNDSVKTMLVAINEVVEAMSRFRELNPEFDDMKGGSSLLLRIKLANKKTHKAYVRLRKVLCIAGPGKQIQDHYQK